MGAQWPAGFQAPDVLALVAYFLFPMAVGWDSLCEPSAGIWPRATSACSSGVSCGAVPAAAACPMMSGNGRVEASCSDFLCSRETNRLLCGMR